MSKIKRSTDGDRSMGRLDLVSQIIAVDEETKTVRMILKPDPRRYEELEVDGERCYRDKFLHHIIPQSMVHRFAEQQARGLPMHASPRAISSATDYAEGRKAALSAELHGGAYSAPKERASAHVEFGVRTSPQSLSFISVDICSSSSLRRADPAAFDRAYEIFIRELGTVVGHFGCSVLKTTGDGFIAYNDYPAFTTQCDNTVDLALTLIVLLRDSLNPALMSDNLPQLAIRVGADYGPASTRIVNVPATGLSTVEVASDALNRCVKIEQTAKPNELRIGHSLYELLHVQWLERCTEVEFDGTLVGRDRYNVYSVR